MEILGVWGRPFDFLHQKAEAAENQFQTEPKQFVTEGVHKKPGTPQTIITIIIFISMMLHIYAS